MKREWDKLHRQERAGPVPIKPAKIPRWQGRLTGVEASELLKAGKLTRKQFRKISRRLYHLERGVPR